MHSTAATGLTSQAHVMLMALETTYEMSTNVC